MLHLDPGIAHYIVTFHLAVQVFVVCVREGGRLIDCWCWTCSCFCGIYLRLLCKGKTY